METTGLLTYPGANVVSQSSTSWRNDDGELDQVHDKDGIDVRLNLDHVAMIRPHHLDRGFTGNEIIFSTGTLSSILVMEDHEYLVGPPRIEQGRDEV